MFTGNTFDLWFTESRYFGNLSKRELLFKHIKYSTQYPLLFTLCTQICRHFLQIFQ